MKRVLYSILLLLLAAAPAMAQNHEALPETFVSDDETITLRYPTGWVVDGTLDGQVTIATNDGLLNFGDESVPSGEAALAMLFPMATEFFSDDESIYASGDPVQTLSNIIKTFNTGSTGEMDFAPAEAISLGDNQAARADGSLMDNDILFVIVDYGNETFSLMAGITADGELEKFAPKLLAIAESVNYAPG